MFDSKIQKTERLTDAVDLLIDFATLGEYGLEPVGRAREGCADRSATRTIARSAHCNLLAESGLFRGPGRNAVRVRGVREASRTFSAGGTA
jgi:hypothetical protein